MSGRSLFQVALAVGISFVASAHLRTIGERTALKLVQEALVTLGATGPSVQIRHWPYYWAPEFYTFQAWRPNPGEGPLLTYYFAVNPWTGDVWDAIGCERITSPAIEREQESILKRLGLPRDAQEILQTKSPACSDMEMKATGPRKRHK